MEAAPGVGFVGLLTRTLDQESLGGRRFGWIFRHIQPSLDRDRARSLWLYRQKPSRDGLPVSDEDRAKDGLDLLNNWTSELQQYVSFLQILGTEDLQEPTSLAPHWLNLLHIFLRECQDIPTRILNVNVESRNNHQR